MDFFRQKFSFLSCLFKMKVNFFFYSTKTEVFLDPGPEGIELKELSIGSSGLVKGQSTVSESDQAGVELRGQS